MTQVTSETEVFKQPGESKLYSMDFTDLLGTSETISSVTSVTEEGTTDLTIANKVVITSETVVDGVTIGVNKGISFRVSGGIHGRNYRIEAIVVTSAANTLEGDGILKVRDC